MSELSSPTTILASLAGGLVTSVGSILKDRSKKARRMRCLKVGTRLAKFVIRDFEAREKAGIVTAEDRANLGIELAGIHGAVFAEFYRDVGSSNIELEPGRTTFTVLLARFLFPTGIILFCIALYGSPRPVYKIAIAVLAAGWILVEAGANWLNRRRHSNRGGASR